MPWPATTSGSSNGWTNASPPSRGALARRDQALVDRLRRRRARSRRAPRAASTLAIGASAGMKTSHGTPRARAAAASACAWLPALPATTPRAQPSSPSAASLAAAPRTLNEPVRCRFSAFSDDRRRPRARRASRDRGPACGARRARRAARTARRRRGDARSAGHGLSCPARRWRRSRPRAPSGSAATPIVVRAGGSSAKNAA